MTEIEYQEFVRHCPYDAMGDYSMFRKEQTENESEDAHMSLKRQIDSQNVRKKKKHRLQKQRKQEKNSRIRNRKQRNTIWNSNIKHETR